MAALTEDQLVEIRRQIGSAPDDATLQEIYDRTENTDELVLEVLETRYADWLRNPASYTIPGEYGETRSAEQIKALQQQIEGLGSDLGQGAVRVVPPPDRYVR